MQFEGGRFYVNKIVDLTVSFMSLLIPVPDLNTTNPPWRISDGRNYLRISSRLTAQPDLVLIKFG